MEGTLNVENVPTTHKRVKEVYQKENPTDKNDVIIKNMLNAMRFIVREKPAFNKENLLKLYNLLSADCLNDEDKLKEGAYYRDGGVFVYALMAAGGDLGGSVGPQLVGLITDGVAASPFASELAASLNLTAEQIGMKCGMLVGAVFPLLAIAVFSVMLKTKKKRSLYE